MKNDYNIQYYDIFMAILLNVFVIERAYNLFAKLNRVGAYTSGMVWEGKLSEIQTEKYKYDFK